MASLKRPHAVSQSGSSSTKRVKLESGLAAIKVEDDDADSATQGSISGAAVKNEDLGHNGVKHEQAATPVKTELDQDVEITREQQADRLITIEYDAGKLQCSSGALCSKSTYFRDLLVTGGEFENSDTIDIAPRQDDVSHIEAMLLYVQHDLYEEEHADWAFHLGVSLACIRYKIRDLEAKAYICFVGVATACSDLDKVGEMLECLPQCLKQYGNLRWSTPLEEVIRFLEMKLAYPRDERGATTWQEDLEELLEWEADSGSALVMMQHKDFRRRVVDIASVDDAVEVLRALEVHPKSTSAFLETYAAVRDKHAAAFEGSEELRAEFLDEEPTLRPKPLAAGSALNGNESMIAGGSQLAVRNIRIECGTEEITVTASEVAATSQYLGELLADSNARLIHLEVVDDAEVATAVLQFFSKRTYDDSPQRRGWELDLKVSVAAVQYGMRELGHMALRYLQQRCDTITDIESVDQRI